MPNIETVYLNYYTLVNIEKEAIYRSEIREEECHGIYTFIDNEELSNNIVSVVIKVLGQEIDITNRLNKNELELLNKIDSDDIEIDDDRVY
jgi:hypothetical protein